MTRRSDWVPIDPPPEPSPQPVRWFVDPKIADTIPWMRNAEEPTPKDGP